MLICHCKGLRDRDVRCAVAQGARSAGQVLSACGAGSICGGCLPLIAEVIAEAQAGGQGGPEGHASRPFAPAAAGLSLIR